MRLGPRAPGKSGEAERQADDPSTAQEESAVSPESAITPEPDGAARPAAAQGAADDTAPLSAVTAEGDAAPEGDAEPGQGVPDAASDTDDAAEAPIGEAAAPVTEESPGETTPATEASAVGTPATEAPPETPPAAEALAGAAPAAGAPAGGTATAAASADAKVPAKERAAASAGPRYRHWWWLPGWIFSALTVLPALVLIAWLVPGTALLLAGRMSRLPMFIIFFPLTIGLCYFVLRQVPVSWPRFPRRVRNPEAPSALVDERAPRSPASKRPDVPVDALIATLAIAAGFGVWQYLLKSQQVIVTRDPGSYLQFGYWIAKHGTARIPQSLAAFGGSHPGMSFTSLGFAQSGANVVPSAMAGMPILLAAGIWLGGVPGALAVAPIVGGCAVLAFAGLAGRLAGPRWAPAAALVLAVSLPELYASRSTFSEPASQVLLFGGLSLIVDSLVLVRRRHGSAGGRGRMGNWQIRLLSGIGGLAAGLTALMRLNALVDLLPMLLFLGVLVAARRRQGWPGAFGLLIGAGLALAEAIALARPYVDSVSSGLRLTGYVAGGIIVVCAVAFGLVRLRFVRRLGLRVLRMQPRLALPGAKLLHLPTKLRGSKRLPSVAGLLPVLAAVLPLLGLAAFLARPYLQTVRGETDRLVINYVAGLQRLGHLRVDGTRRYAEDSLYWVIWYIGLPSVLLAAAGLMMLTRRTMRAFLNWRDVGSAARVWVLPLLVFGWSAAWLLYRPGSVPDQPWASHRLVAVVLPGLIVVAVWVSARLKAHAEFLGATRITGGIVASCCVLAMAVPAALTSIGVTQKSGKVDSAGLAFKRTYQGEVLAAEQMCGAIGRDAGVVIVDRVTADGFAQLVRGMCDTPTVVMLGAPAGSVQSVVSSIAQAGRHPVVLASSRGRVSAYGGNPEPAINLVTTQDAATLVSPPTKVSSARYSVWLVAPDGTAVG